MPSKFVSVKCEELKLNPIDEKKTVVAKLASDTYPVESMTTPPPLNPLSKLKYRWRLMTTTELLDGWECVVFDCVVLSSVVAASYYSYQLVTSFL